MRFTNATAALAAGLVGAAALPAGADTVVLEPVKDNTIYEDPEGLFSNGAGIHCFVGQNGTDETRRALLAFDVAAAIPPGATVESVTLEMRMSRTIAGPTAVTLHRALADWGEGNSDAFGQEGNGSVADNGDATWLHRFYDTIFWTNPGGDFDPDVSASTVVDDLGDYAWSSPGMVADVQAWLDDPDANFGWFLRGDESGPTTAKRFDTREHTDPGVRPRLTIEFSTGPALAELLAFNVAFGTHVSGGLSDLATSDDAHLRARSRVGFSALEPNLMELTIAAQTDAVDPAALNVSIEERYNQPINGTSKFRLRNWSTGSFQQIQTFTLTNQDTLREINGIDATNYVRASDGRIETSIKHVVIATFSAIGFDSYFDLVEIAVE